MGATQPEQCVLKLNEMPRVKCFASGDTLLGDTCIAAHLHPIAACKHPFLGTLNRSLLSPFPGP